MAATHRAVRWLAPWGPGVAAVGAVAWLVAPWPTAWAPLLLTGLGWALVALVLALRLGASRLGSRPWSWLALVGLLAVALKAPEALVAWPGGAKAWWLAGLGVAGLLALVPSGAPQPSLPFARRVALRLAARRASGALDPPAHQAALVGLRPGLGAWLEAVGDAHGAWPVLGVALAVAWGAPDVAFLALALAELGAWWRDLAAQPDALAQALDAAARPLPSSGPWVAPWFASPLRVELGAEAASALAPRRQALAEALQAEGGLLGALGGALAEAERQGGAWPAWLGPVGDLMPEAYALRVHGAMVAEGELRAGARLVRPHEALAWVGREGADGGLWVTGQELAKARRSGVELLRPEALLAHALREAVAEHEGEWRPALAPLNGSSAGGARQDRQLATGHPGASFALR